MVPTIHIVDDDRSFRTAVARFLEASGFRVLGYPSGAEILAAPDLDEPGCILLDFQMPGLNGLDLQKLLANKAPLLPIIFLSGQGTIEATVRAMRAGADDFLEKPASGEALLSSIERALRRYDKARTEFDRDLGIREKLAALTPREVQVLGLMIRGKRIKEIAYEIGTSERTVKAHKSSLMGKLQVGSVAEAVTIAAGFVSSDARPIQPDRAS